MHQRAFNPVHLLSLAGVLGALLSCSAGVGGSPASTPQPQACRMVGANEHPRLRRRRGRVDAPVASDAPCASAC